MGHPRRDRLDRNEVRLRHRACAAPAPCTSTARPCALAASPVGDVAGKNVTTIEGLSPDSKHPVQQAWLAEDVPQCGYCQSGQIMAAVAFLKEHPKPTDADIDANLTNICRCGTYVRIRSAIHRAAALMKT